MKRGWITWDREELPKAAFDERIASARRRLAQQDLPALVVYTDVWRSNQGRHFSNFMPYWNRALLVIPREGAPTLLCGLSPRVYPWIRSVTILDEIVPSPNLAKQLFQMCSTRGWERIGVLGLDTLPYDLHLQLGTGDIEFVDVELPLAPDEYALGLYKRAAALAREVLGEELAGGVGMLDHEFVGKLERRFRRLGAEDLVILVTNGQTAPAPARGNRLGPDFSISLALEYRGHWVKLARSACPRDPVPVRLHVENLSGSYPYEPSGRLATRAVLAVRSESQAGDARLFHGDTYWSGNEGLELL